MKTVLVVEDEAGIRELIAYNLETDGYTVLEAGDGETGWSLFCGHSPDLVLLDILLPGLDGLELCRRIRSAGTVPVIMVSARVEEFDKVLALELGADDYLTKPFSVRELRARVRALLRRTGGAQKPAPAFRYGALRLLPEEHRVLRGDREIPLTRTEYQILECLLRNPKQVLTRDLLAQQIWGTDYYGETRTIDVHVRHLREKVEEDPSRPRVVRTVRGLGYRLGEDTDEED